MNRPPLCQVSVTTTTEAEDAVTELLESVFTQPASIYFDEKRRRPVVSVYLAGRSTFNPVQRAALSAGLKRIQSAGLNPGPGRVSVKRLPRENWAESWKKHFRPIEAGPVLLVKPSWSRRRARKNQAVVVLDPGLSFGTGQHATTGFCLRQLVRCQKDGQAKSFLDIGTGSGILAIAAAKLGYAPVEAFDFDPESVRVAQANARQNGVSRRIKIFQADLTRLPLHGRKKFGLVCANLISTLLVAERRRIVNRLEANGVLVLAGILAREFAEVRRAYEVLGLELASARTEKEWRSGAFIRRGKF
jgi:ribosomal protein L11 methyltransferase